MAPLSPAPSRPADADRAPTIAQPLPKDQGSVAGHSDEGSRGGTDGVEWHPKREYSWDIRDFAVTGGAAAVIIGSAVISPTTRHWKGGALYDEDVRDFLRVGNLYGRYAVRDASDVGVSFASAWPFLMDALITAWWYRGRSDLAFHMGYVAAEAFAISGAVQGISNHVGSRERPYGRLCGTEIPENSVDCENSVRYRSFFSGHTTLAFTSAGLLCMNHLGLRLLSKEADIATCIGGFTVATLTSVFRIMSDMHYATDVTLGALFGTVIGLGVPFFHFTSPGMTAPAAGKATMRFGAVGQGLGILGSF